MTCQRSEKKEPFLDPTHPPIPCPQDGRESGDLKAHCPQRPLVAPRRGQGQEPPGALLPHVCKTGLS